jgi:hypothetical protein
MLSAMVKKIDMRVGEDIEGESCGHFQYSTPIIIEKIVKEKKGHDAEVRTRHFQNARSRLFPVRRHIRFVSHVFRYDLLPFWPMSLS